MKALYSILFVMSFFHSLSSARATEIKTIYAKAYRLDLDGSLHAISPAQGMRQFTFSTHFDQAHLLATLRLTLLEPQDQTISSTLLQLKPSIGALPDQLHGSVIQDNLISAYPQNQPSEIAIVFYAFHYSRRQPLRHRTCNLSPSFVFSLPSRSE